MNPADKFGPYIFYDSINGTAKAFVILETFFGETSSFYLHIPIYWLVMAYLFF